MKKFKVELRKVSKQRIKWTWETKNEKPKSERYWPMEHEEAKEKAYKLCKKIQKEEWKGEVVRWDGCCYIDIEPYTYTAWIHLA